MSRINLQWLKLSSVTLDLSNIKLKEVINKSTNETLNALDALTWQEEEILDQSELLKYYILLVF